MYVTIAIAPDAKQRDRQLWTTERQCCNALQRVIGWELVCTCNVSSSLDRQS